MKIKFHNRFKKAYKLRIASNKKLVKQVQQRISLFQNNSKDPLLKDHGLTGAKRKLRAFSVTGDIRIVYLPISESEVMLFDIGSHNQVY